MTGFSRAVDPEGDHVETGTSIVEPSLHGRPREDMVPLETAERLERADFDRGLDHRVELQAQFARWRGLAGDVRQRPPRGVDQLFLALMHVGGKQEELWVFDREAA